MNKVLWKYFRKKASRCSSQLVLQNKAPLKLNSKHQPLIISQMFKDQLNDSADLSLAQACICSQMLDGQYKIALPGSTWADFTLFYVSHFPGRFPRHVLREKAEGQGEKRKKSRNWHLLLLSICLSQVYYYPIGQSKSHEQAQCQLGQEPSGKRTKDIDSGRPFNQGH